MKKLLILVTAFFFISKSAKADMIGTFSYACQSQEALDIFAVAMIEGNIPVVEYLYTYEGCLVFKGDTKVQVLKAKNNKYKVSIEDKYIGYIYKVSLIKD